MQQTSPEGRIRETAETDMPCLERLYAQAFPQEDLIPLLRNLLHQNQPVLSLASCQNDELISHVAFTTGTLPGNQPASALLGPLCTAPGYQGRGIARQLIDHGIQRLRHEGIKAIFVLGDPALYGRFGFKTETQVTPPYPLPDEWQGAWQSIELSAPFQPMTGKLKLPEAWMDPNLWTP